MEKKKMLKKVDGTFHLDFTFKGKRYRVDSGRARLRDAETFEANFRKQIAEKWEEEQKQKQIKELYSQSKLDFEQAWNLFYLNKFNGQESKNINDIKAIVFDIAEYAKANDYKFFDIPEEALKDYMQVVLNHGTYAKKVKGKGVGNSNSNYNKKLAKIKFFYKTVCKLCKVANPTDDLETIKSDVKARSEFKLEYVNKIKETCKDDFIYPIFFIGSHTGLRLGDIVHLRWSDIKVDETKGFKFFKVTTRKTNTAVEIPFINGMEDYLNELDHSNMYILPKHKELYEKRPAELTIQFQEMISKIIPQDEIWENRTRGKKHAKLDIHSLRHTFAYISAINGVPQNVVQSILGHTTADMTAHYQAHANRDIANRELAKMTFSFEKKESIKDKLLELVCMLNNDNLNTTKQEMLNLIKNM